MVEPHLSLQAFRTSGGGNLPVRRIVVHATCGGRGYPHESAAGVARQTAMYFAGPNAAGSAHYVCDVAGEEHTLPDGLIAWHAPPNARSIGVEICADGGEPYKDFVPYTRQQWLSPQVWPAVKRAAQRVRELALRHGVPMVRLTVTEVRAGVAGICGHVDVSEAFGQSDHTDPGEAFPWAEFMTLVRSSKEDSVPLIVSLGLKAPQVIQPGKTVSAAWTVEYSDAEDVHAEDGAAVRVNDRFWCIADGMVNLSGIKHGDRIAMAWSRFTRDGKTLKDDAWGWLTTRAGREDRTCLTEIGGQFQLDEARQLRLRLRSDLDYPVELAVGTLAKLTLLWRG